MVTAALEYPAAIWASAFLTSAAVSSRSLRAPMTVRIGARTFWFLVIVLGERPSSPVASQSSAGLAYGVVDVAGLRGDALVEFLVQVPELVDDGGLGLPADLAPVALAVAGVAEGDLAAPQSGAVPVASGIAAGAAAVFE
jgi:hypothetical protein